MMNVDGNWNCTIYSPMGSQQAVMTFSTRSGALSGKIEATHGTQEFSGGRVDGNRLGWNVEMTSPMSMTLVITAEIDGDSISGHVKLGAFGEATFAGSRA